MGLIGASLALRLQELGHTVSGSVRSERSREILQKRGLQNTCVAAEFTPARLADTDILVLGLNISDCLTAIDAAMALPELRESLLITDLCSTKQLICRQVASEYPSARFIGAHPMAGKETQGPAAAESSLFAGCTVYLSPARPADEQQAQDALTIARLWQSVGANTAMIDAGDHDRRMAYVSHGLHLAACLIARMSREAAGEIDSPSPAAGSYRDMTRIALSSGDMWQDIIASNSANVADWLRQLSRESEALAASLEAGQSDFIVSLFREAAAAREIVMRT